MDTTSWNYNDFLAFLMVYAAYADLRISDEEKEFIRQRVGKEGFEKMVNFYEELNDIDRINVLVDFKKRFCHSEEDLKTILADFASVLKEDHNIDAGEAAVFLGLRHLLKNVN